MPNPEPNKTIIIVDDEPEIRQLIQRYLGREGFHVDACANGDELWQILSSKTPDLIIMDIRLPGDDGLTLTREVYRRFEIPIILLTSRSEIIDRVAGLESGADDYISKPFDLRELLARINAILRRSARAVQGSAQNDEINEYHFNEWTLNIARQELSDPKANHVALSPAEFQLLKVLVGNPNRVLTREFLMEKTYGRTTLPYDRSIDVRIGHLRRKLNQSADQAKPIKTIRGSGYLFSAEISAN